MVKGVALGESIGKANVADGDAVGVIDGVGARIGVGLGVGVGEGIIFCQ